MIFGDNHTNSKSFMLSEKIKQAVRESYKAIGTSLPNFHPRQQQTFLVAEIAKTLAGEYSKDRKIITIEAGTGTGKSLAYSLGSIPLALVRQKKVCISTATVALQEQLINKDLPFLKERGKIDFDFTLVKGRQRYVCAQKLAQAVSQNDEPQAGFTFAEKPNAADIRILNKMHTALNDKTWSGDRDSWPDTIAQHIWQQIQSDKHSCLRNLAEHTHCPFHKARETMELADVLVVNHSLLLADLELGGGKILPEPSDTFYIIDEAHHLPKVTRDYSSASISLKGALDWLTKMQTCGDKIAKLVKTQSAISPSLKLADDTLEITADLQKVISFLTSNQTVYFAKETLYRFENGIVPKTIKNNAESLADASKRALAQINKLYNLLMDSIKENEVKLYLAEPLLAEAGFFIQRLENFHHLTRLYAKTDNEKGAPLARWVELSDAKKQDFVLSASPIEVGFMLEDMLWSRCEGAVLCSATIRALNKFDHFMRQAGLSANDGSQYQHVLSPFDYQQNARLVIPKMQYEPSHDSFSDELVKKLPALLKPHQASLVLFSSYWQMEKVADAIRAKHSFPIQIQGEQSRQKIIDSHTKRVQANKQSIIFGTQSFSEGLDLPGELLTNLIITKLPFSVPTSPVEEAQAEYVTAKGGNPFMSLSVPDASKKLVQAVGRLLRNEKDQGVITLLDRRIVSKRYGKELLDALPPFARDIEY